MSDSLRPDRLPHARLPCPSPTDGACSDSCPLSQWCYATISSSVIHFSSLFQSFPASGSFPVSVFSCMCLYCCCGICLPCRQVAIEGITSMLMKPLADHSGHITEEEDMWDYKSWSQWGGMFGEVVKKTWQPVDPQWWDPGNRKLLIPPLFLDVHSAHNSSCGSHFEGHCLERAMCVEMHLSTEAS